MSNLNNLPVSRKDQNLDDFESAQVGRESKFWRKVKQDPVVPIGMFNFFFKFKFYLIFNLFSKVWQDLV
jgi:hypothetical protein